jgi:hypothetical protein
LVPFFVTTEETPILGRSFIDPMRADFVDGTHDLKRYEGIGRFATADGSGQGFRPSRRLLSRMPLAVPSFAPYTTHALFLSAKPSHNHFLNPLPHKNASQCEISPPVFRCAERTRQNTKQG